MLDCDFDYILTDCASCESTLKQYVDAKFISIGELILQENIKFEFPKPIKVTFHKPCHLEHDNFLEPLLKNCKNVEYIKMDNYDDCCGLAGEFSIKNNKISREISRQKILHYVEQDVDYIITTCPACLLGLNQGLAEINTAKKPEAINLFVFLAKYCKPSI